MKKWKRNVGLVAFIVLFILGNFSLGISSDSDEKVAIVCFLEGKAWILEPGEKERGKIDLFDWIKIGAIVETDIEAKLVLAFSSGDRYELGEKTKVVATGGYAELMAEETAVIDVINPDLTLIGLRLIYLMNKD